MHARFAALVAAALPSAAAVAQSPLRLEQLDPAAGEARFTADRARIRDLAALADRTTVLRDVALPDGELVDLALTRVDLARRRFGFRVDGEPRPDLLAGLDLSVWRGSAAGEPDSEVMLSFSSTVCGGWIRRGSELVHLIPRPDDGGGWRGGRVLAVTEASLNQRGASLDFQCAAAPVPGAPVLPPAAPPSRPGPQGPTAEAPRECTIAIESDYQLFEVFGDLDAMATYIASLLAAVSDRYELQANTVLTFPYVQFYTTPDDPWTSQDNGGNCIDVLYELQAAWAGDIPEDATIGHLLSGASLGCGVAWLDVLCNQDYSFSVSGNMDGLVSFPVVQQSYNWDFIVVAHELGHNFATPHTHDFCPPLDECPPNPYFGDCQDEQVCLSDGTIMSYCHLCPGGTGNITTWFHPVVSDVITAGAADCLPVYELMRADPPSFLLPDVGTTVAVEVAGEPAGPVELLYRYGNGFFQALEMDDEGGGTYRVDFPPPDCADQPQFYFQYEDATFGTLLLPADAPGEVFVAEIGIPVPKFVDDFEQEQGWTVEEEGATAGYWERGVPVVDAEWPYAPDSDYDGSGQCYLTGNEEGNSDVDGGAVRLVSPPLDFESGVVTLAYAYFFWVDTDGSEALVVEASDGPSGPWIEIARHDEASTEWRTNSFGRTELEDLGVQMNAEVYVRFVVEDDGAPNIVEAAIDTFHLSYLHCDTIGSSFCSPANLNSTGGSAVVRAVGSEVAADNEIVLVASGLPPEQFGYFITSMDPGFVPFPPGSQGNLCLSGAIGRYRKDVLNSLGEGWMTFLPDLTKTPTPEGTTAIQPGETWYFQTWFRDLNPGPTSNLTDAVAITFQ